MILESALVKELAGQLGFDLVGIATAASTGREEFFRHWLSQNYHGQMSYLARNIEKRCDVRKLCDWSRSVICVGMNYFGDTLNRDAEDRQGRTARYAWRDDYHTVLKERLTLLKEQLQQANGGQGRFRACVDTAPLFEKAYAAQAGLGWIGKNGLLLNKRFGSWLVLGELVTDLELEADAPVADGCGDCRRCLDACPTGALTEARVIDARRCISYLTIESSSAGSQEQLSKTDDWVFGCDLCQEACPYNKGVVRDAADWPIHADWSAVDFTEAFDLDEDGFKQRFKGSSILRMGYEHFIERCCELFGR